MGQATGPIYTCETTGHAPIAVLRALPGHRIRPICTQPHEMCVQLLPTKPQYSPLDGMQANGKPLLSSTHAQTTTMDGAWARRAHEGPCGGYVGLVLKAKL